MTRGQELAIEQIRAIEAADGAVFEIIEAAPPPDDGACLTVVISLNCGGIECVAGGLPLRERERFAILIPPDFPFAIPEVFAMHYRFAGKPHVQWKRRLCIYQAPQTEWDSADGMFGFIDRLWTWLEHGAKNLADPVGMPIHPPVAYRGESNYIIVPCINTPKVGDTPWYGFAGLEKINDRALSLVNWQHVSNSADPAMPVAATVLAPGNLPWEMPTRLEDLCKELENSGVRRGDLLCLLKFALLINPKDHPLFVVVGSPQRGVQSSGEFKYHLMVWQVSGLVLDCLNLSADWIRLQFRLNTVNTSEGEALRQEATTRRAEVERLTMDCINAAAVNWCTVLEDRPEIIIRRDQLSPVGVFRGRHICVWGCGALGSHIAYYLVKAGVKKLTLIDNGIIKPGLLVRQMYEKAEVGVGKVFALKGRLARIDPGVQIEAIQRSVFGDVSLNDDDTGADVVIDCTASDLVHAKSELAWTTQGRKRPPIISMIVGPRAERGIVVIANSDATGAIKDTFRKAKLMACQRPELSAFANDFYPKNNIITLFQPEPGCSDPTFEGSCADVAGLSALLLNAGAKLLQNGKSSSAACFICQPHVVSAKSREAIFAEFCFEGDIVCRSDFEIRLSQRAWKEMATAIREGRRKRGARAETGGLLFGKRDDALRVIWVDDAIGPPPDSVCSPEIFVCGIKGTQEATSKRKEQSRGSLEFVGMWHTHPRDVPLPSTTDLSGMMQMLTSGEAPPLRSLLMIVGWERDEIHIGTSVFNRSLFQNGGGTLTLAINRFGDLRI